LTFLNTFGKEFSFAVEVIPLASIAHRKREGKGRGERPNQTKLLLAFLLPLAPSSARFKFC
jgi:hypothetical protein